MKLALLGIDADALEIARAAARARHAVVVVCADPDELASLGDLAQHAEKSDDWESLLTRDDIDAVVVARSGDEELRIERLKRLVQAAVPLLVVQPACESIVGYELEMIRDDTSCVAVPYFPGRYHDAVRGLESLLAEEDSPIGDVEQVTFERTIAGERNKERVLGHLACDVELIGLATGKINRVATLGRDGKNEQPYANLSVQMSGPSGVAARWSIAAADEDTEALMTVVGTGGKIKLTMPADESAWTLQKSRDDAGARSFPDSDSAGAALEMLEHVIDGAEPVPTWADACRDLEVVSSVERSLRRGRTIQIYDAEHSEEQTFKGIMSVGGCGILLAVLIILSLVAAIGGLTRSLTDPGAEAASRGESERLPIQASEDSSGAHILVRIWPVYPLALFLMLQFLRMVFKKPGSSAQANGDEPTAGAAAN